MANSSTQFGYSRGLPGQIVTDSLKPVNGTFLANVPIAFGIPVRRMMNGDNGWVAGMEQTWVLPWLQADINIPIIGFSLAEYLAGQPTISNTGQFDITPQYQANATMTVVKAGEMYVTCGLAVTAGTKAYVVQTTGAITNSAGTQQAPNFCIGVFTTTTTAAGITTIEFNLTSTGSYGA